jgi:hypothetical protein
MTDAERLKQALEALAKLKQEAKKKAARKAATEKEQFPGSHRGF